MTTSVIQAGWSQDYGRNGHKYGINCLILNLLQDANNPQNDARSYFQDENFAAGADKEISLWRFYNLLTGANKFSYIDDFLDRTLNASQIADGLTDALSYGDNGYSWFLK